MGRDDALLRMICKSLREGFSGNRRRRGERNVEATFRYQPSTFAISGSLWAIPL
jgi:hypothetical protein